MKRVQNNLIFRPTAMLWLVALLCVAQLRGALTQSCPHGCKCENKNFTMECESLTSFPLTYPDTITDFIFTDCDFQNITDVPFNNATVLVIRSSNITTISDSAFALCSQLEILDISSNLLKGVTSGTFTGLTRLTKLSLEQNLISHLEDNMLTNLPSLTSLDLSGNLITMFATKSFTGPKSLTSIKLADCGLTSVPTVALQSALELQNLSLSQNNFTNIPEGSFKGLKMLRFLNLEDCNIRTLNKDCLEDQEVLFEVRLNRNKLVQVPEDLFDECKDIITIVRLEGNNLTQLSYKLFPDKRWSRLELFLDDNPWICDCNMYWIKNVPEQDEDATCALPVVVHGRSLFNISQTILEACREEHRHYLAWIIGLPIIILCVIFVGYYLYKIYQRKRRMAALKKRGAYSNVYQDPSEPKVTEQL